MEIKKTLGLGSKALEGRDRPAAVDKAAQKTATASGAEALAAGDRVEISDRSREMAKAAEVLASTPEVRQQKVEEIKTRIENDEYEVDADKVAQKMIVDFLTEIT